MATTSNLTFGTGILNVTGGTLRTRTLNTGASGTTGSVEGSWSVAGGSTFVATSVVSQANSATITATSGNTANQIVLRDGSGGATLGYVQTTSLTTGASGTAGTVTGNWSLSAGSRFQATYADLAEYYEGDIEYQPGTVLIFGGDKEVTISNKAFDTRVAGVVSENAAYIMNSDCPGTKVCIALQGRVPCKVVGRIQKGDLLVTSSIAGVAIAAGNNAKVGTVIGKSLENYDSDHIGIIEVAVGRT
jgi:hypothetical protein